MLLNLQGYSATQKLSEFEHFFYKSISNTARTLLLLWCDSATASEWKPRKSIPIPNDITFTIVLKIVCRFILSITFEGAMFYYLSLVIRKGKQKNPGRATSSSRSKPLTLGGREKVAQINVCIANKQMHDKHKDQLPLPQARWSKC